MTNCQYMRKRLMSRIALRVPSYIELMASEVCPEFKRACMARKLFGAFRYGLLRASDKPRYDRVTDMIKRLERYRRDRNAEHLVDVANLAELEYAEGGGAFRAVDDGEHTRSH